MKFYRRHAYFLLMSCVIGINFSLRIFRRFSVRFPRSSSGKKKNIIIFLSLTEIQDSAHSRTFTKNINDKFAVNSLHASLCYFSSSRYLELYLCTRGKTNIFHRFLDAAL